MSERNIKLVIEYEGTAFAGWQYQPQQRTVQGEIIQAIFRVTDQRVPLIGAGRTDAGVHALGQVANFKIDHKLEAERFRDAINYYLPDDIRIKESSEVDHGFHATRDARFRRYRYLLSDEKSAIYRNLRWENPASIDVDVLREAAAAIVGEHDFSPFCVVASRKEDNTCRIEQSKWRRVGPLLVYEIRGNRFLHSMIRSLVGAMVNIASLKQDANSRNLTLERFRDIISAQTDERVVFTAPAHGLYLVSVEY